MLIDSLVFSLLCMVFLFGSFIKCPFAFTMFTQLWGPYKICMVCVNMTMCYITDLLLVGSLLALLFCITHLSLLYMRYKCNHCLLLNLQIKFGWHSSYHTITLASFANIFRYTTYLLTRSFFWSKAMNWWNNLPITLISSSETKFSHELYI